MIWLGSSFIQVSDVCRVYVPVFNFLGNFNSYLQHSCGNVNNANFFACVIRIVPIMLA